MCSGSRWKLDWVIVFALWTGLYRQTRRVPVTKLCLSDIPWFESKLAFSRNATENFQKIRDEISGTSISRGTSLSRLIPISNRRSLWLIAVLQSILDMYQMSREFTKKNGLVALINRYLRRHRTSISNENKKGWAWRRIWKYPEFTASGTG